MIYTHVAAFLAGAISLGAGIYQIQEWRYTAKEKDRVESQLENERHAAKSALANQNRVVAAQNQAQAHARTLRLDADGARTALVGMYNAVDTTMRDAAVSHAACTERTATLGELLKTMGEAGRVIAQKADLHASDAVTLRDAWPK